MTFNMPTITVGWLIAFFVLVACFIMALVGQLDVKLAVLIGGVALSRLL